jgi:hypothetical protein
VNDFETSDREKSVNFVGNPRKNKYLPGYIFQVKSQADYNNLKLILTRCVFEAQSKKSADKAEDYDEDFLANQLQGDFASAAAADVKMDEDDFYFTSDDAAGDQTFKKQQEKKDFQRLLAQIDASMIEEVSPSREEEALPQKRGAATASSKRHKTDKYGNYRYFDESDEDL